MDLGNIKKQLELSKKTIEEYEKQNRIFDMLLSQAVKGAPEKDKKQIQKLQITAKKVVNLAKNGKLNEANELIKNFQNGGQNNK